MRIRWFDPIAEAPELPDHFPGVQHTEETNLCTEMSGIASDFEKSFRAGTKQQIVDHLFVLQHHWGQVAGECEDHVQITRGEQFSSPCSNPPFASSGLTLWAMAITAAVIRDRSTMCAAGALIEMSAERSRTTARNGQQYFDILPTDPLAVSLDEGSSSNADEIGNLERRRGHGSTSSPIVTQTYIKTAWQSLLRSLMRSVRRRAATSKRAGIEWSG